MADYDYALDTLQKTFPIDNYKEASEKDEINEKVRKIVDDLGFSKDIDEAIENKKFDNLYVHGVYKANPKESDLPWLYVVDIAGGCNGPGEWSQYLKGLVKVFDALDEEFATRLIKLDNDCLDDVFDAYIGIQEKRKD